MKESDLFEPLKKYLIETMGCTKIYAEVLDCDVLAVCYPVNIAVETKTSLNFKVIDQAIKRKWMAQYIYIAVPKPKEIHGIVRDILEQHGIGLLLYEDYHFQMKIQAKYNRLGKKPSEIREEYVKSYHETQISGVKSGQCATDYSVMVKNIKRVLEFEKRFRKGDGWVTIDKILEECDTHYKNPKPSLIATLRKNWNANWCETQRINGVFCVRLRDGCEDDALKILSSAIDGGIEP